MDWRRWETWCGSRGCPVLWCGIYLDVHFLHIIDTTFDVIRRLAGLFFAMISFITIEQSLGACLRSTRKHSVSISGLLVEQNNHQNTIREILDLQTYDKRQ